MKQYPTDKNLPSQLRQFRYELKRIKRSISDEFLQRLIQQRIRIQALLGKLESQPREPHLQFMHEVATSQLQTIQQDISNIKQQSPPNACKRNRRAKKQT
jgi:hypothetical protein